jgi:hypothetical protein
MRAAQVVSHGKRTPTANDSNGKIEKEGVPVQLLRKETAVLLDLPVRLSDLQ